MSNRPEEAGGGIEAIPASRVLPEARVEGVDGVLLRCWALIVSAKRPWREVFWVKS